MATEGGACVSACAAAPGARRVGVACGRGHGRKADVRARGRTVLEMFDVRIHGGGDGDDYSIYFVVAGLVRTLLDRRGCVPEHSCVSA